jgi:hypothetical protein
MSVLYKLGGHGSESGGSANRRAAYNARSPMCDVPDDGVAVPGKPEADPRV